MVKGIIKGPTSLAEDRKEWVPKFLDKSLWKRLNLSLRCKVTDDNVWQDARRHITTKMAALLTAHSPVMFMRDAQSRIDSTVEFVSVDLRSLDQLGHNITTSKREKKQTWKKTFWIPRAERGVEEPGWEWWAWVVRLSCNSRRSSSRRHLEPRRRPSLHNYRNRKGSPVSAGTLYW